MNPDFPGPGQDEEHQQREEIVSRGDEIEQPVGRPAGGGNIESGPEHHGGEEGQDCAHGLDPKAGHDLAAHEMGKTGCHSTGWAGDAGAGFELTFLKTELAVGADAIAAGIQFGGDEKHAQTCKGDGQRDSAAAPGKLVLG